MEKRNEKLSHRVWIFDSGFRGICPNEISEQITVINQLRDKYPNVIHPRNEGKRNYNQTIKEKLEGMTTGASDVIIPAKPAFVCELKRKDRTKSRVSDEQIKYLNHCAELGAFACVAYGHEQVAKAVKQWELLRNKL